MPYSPSILVCRSIDLSTSDVVKWLEVDMANGTFKNINNWHGVTGQGRASYSFALRWRDWLNEYLL